MRSLFLRLTAAAVVLAAGARPVCADAIALQRAQTAVNITVVIPATVAGIVDGRELRRFASLWHYEFLPPVLAPNQGAVPVQATVVASTGQELTLNTLGVTINDPTSARQVSATCPFRVQVTPKVTTSQWQLDSGLTGDFSNGSATFPGTGALWSLYSSPFTGSPSAPPSNETFTAYIVYPNNNNTWQLAYPVGSTVTGNASFCVDLQINIPAGTPAGSYNATAVYTLYY